MLTDCHTHLASYGPQEVGEIVLRAEDANVRLIITAGTTLDTSRIGVDLAQAHPSLYASIGIHPMRLLGGWDEHSYEILRHLAQTSPKVVAISETGIDYLPNAPDRHWQQQAFREQIRLARELDLPIIWHSQISTPGVSGEHSETLRILKEEGGGALRGVMHYFQADEATAWAAIHGGFLISLAKPLLRLPHLEEVARRIPLQHIVLETDASPQPWKPYRHEWTEPRDVATIASKLAEVKGLSVRQVAESTTSNLMKMLRLPI